MITTRRHYLGLFTALFILAQSANALAMNGREWIALSPDEKNFYLIGYRDAMGACSAFATPKLNSGTESVNSQCGKLVSWKENKAVGLVTKVGVIEFRDALDQFYIDATNCLILVPRALGLAFMKIIGTSEKELDEMLRFERDMASRIQK